MAAEMMPCARSWARFSMTEPTVITIQARTVIKIILVVAAFVFLYVLRDVLAILFIAIMIASAVTPLATWLETKRIPRLLGVLVLYLMLFGLLVLFLSLVIPIASAELNQLGTALPDLLSRFSDVLERSRPPSGYFDFTYDLQNFLDSFSRFLQVSSSSVVGLLINVFGGLLSFLAVVVLSFYLSVMKQGIPVFLRSVLPDQYEGYAIGLWRRAELKMGRWFQGQVLLALVVGVVVFVGLSLLHIKYALVLGIAAMLLEVIPIVGPVIAAMPALALAFFQSPGLGLAVLMFYIVVQQLESQVLAPIILGKTTGLHPVTVVIALLIGGKLAGILGVLLAVPLAVVIVEVLEDLAESRAKRNPLAPQP